MPDTMYHFYADITSSILWVSKKLIASSPSLNTAVTSKPVSLLMIKDDIPFLMICSSSTTIALYILTTLSVFAGNLAQILTFINSIAYELPIFKLVKIISKRYVKEINKM